MPKRCRGPYAVVGTCLLMLLSMAAAQPQPGFDLPDDLDEAPRCVAHELNVPTQGFYLSGSGFYLSGSGFYLSGSTGGMIRGAITYVDPELKHPNTTLPALGIGDIMLSMGLPSSGRLFHQGLVEDVLIVVADDFAGGHFGLPDALQDPAAATTTLADLRPLIASGEFSHGALVMHHLNAAVAATGDFTLVTGLGRDDVTVWTQSVDGPRLIVAGLDLTSATGTTGPVAISEADVYRKLTDGLESLIPNLPVAAPPARIVVNMSWVLLPCPTVEAFIANIDAYPTFLDYLAGLGIGIDDLSAALGALNSSLDRDLQALLNSPERVRRQGFDVAYVAAAGNFSLGYQMLPAGWSEVLGVAVEEVPREFPGRYSNVGDVTVPGEWVAFRPLRDGSPGVPTLLAYAGTSYAAPVAALYVALDMASANLCVRAPAGLGASAPTPPTLELHPGPGTAPADVPLVAAIDACVP